MSFHRNHTKNQDAANMHEVKEMLTKECLLDGFLALYEECTHDNLLKIKSVSSFIHKFKNTVYQSKKHRMKASDFEVKAVIGRGHFGEVRVVREKATDAIYAMKVLRKTDLLAQPEISCYEEERDIMGNSASPWITELHFAFQDSCNLYLVMDFHAGGDLLSLLSRHDDIFEEDMAKFYLAETAIAINSLHEMGYLHRDIKPENILLDCTGHVKLADFGSAAKLNSEKKVTAHMPVGTPDYVAPELLNSMSKARQRLTYGPEVDWWSLGVCAYEMLFGATPFSNEHGSMVSTYANIMDFKNSLRFPTESDVSEDGKDLVKKLLTDSHSRLTWTEIKAHPFFKGVNWDTIREGEAVYVPSIHGLDDTSHFDEVETVKRQPDIEAFIQPKDFSGRDLPFVGFTFSKDSPQDSNNSHAVSEQTSISSSNTRLLQKLEEKNQELEKLRAILHKQHISPNDLETRAVSLMENLSAMNDEIRVLEDELLEVRLEEMQAEIIMLESGHEKLKAQLREKESQLLKTQTSLQDVNNQLQSQQFKLERERRKSREGQHKDLVLLELRNETWESLLADKQASIDELTAKLHELEELVEAYEDSQEKQATQVQELQQKMNTSLHDLSTYTVSDVNLSGDSTQAKVELDNLHHALCPSKKKLTLHVTLKSGRCSFLDNKTLNKLQMLQKMVDKYADKAKEWRDKEEELILKISSLESDNNILKQKEGMGRKMKDSLMEKVSSYQQEVETQKSIIKDLQGTMRSYLNKSLSVTETESKLKVFLTIQACIQGIFPHVCTVINIFFQETQQSKLNLESELMSLKEEAERSRHSALQKARQMEDAIHKLEEQRALAQDYKKRYDCQVEVTEAKVASLEDELTKVTCDRQRLERRETTLAAQVETLTQLLDDRSLEMEKLERRNADIQVHLQQLQQRNTDLQVQIESLQKSSVKIEDQKESKAELNFQISHLRQQNSDLERRLTSAIREKQNLEDKISLTEREKERLVGRIERLEALEKDKRQLESKLEKMATLEREKRRLEVKLERLSCLEKDKLNLEEKVEKLELENRREKVRVAALTADKQELETKLKQLEDLKTVDTTQEMAQLKVKAALLEMSEKEKARIEKELATLRLALETSEKNKEVEKSLIVQLKAEKVVAEREKGKIEKEKIALEKEKEAVQREKLAMEGQLNQLVKEKEISDEHLAKLNKEINRLESSLGRLETSAGAEREVNKLSLEINRLKSIIDRMEKQRGGQTRTSGETRCNLVEKLQKENAELRKQNESLEKQVACADSQKIVNKRTSLAMLQASGWKKTQELADKEKVFEDLKVKGLEQQLVVMRSDLTEKEKLIEELRANLDLQTANVADLRNEIEDMMTSENDLVAQLEKEALSNKTLTEENEKLSAKVKECDVSDPRNVSVEKLQLEIRELTSERDELKARLGCGEQDEKGHLLTQVKSLQQQLDESKREMEIRKGANEFSAGDIPAYLRHELEESNLALSEARSLLAASKRQELELKDRIDRLQRILDNKAVENGRYLQNAQDAMAELKTLKSQFDTLQRQYKVLEGKYSALQKERGSNTGETVRLMEEVQNKQQQYQMEYKKAEQLAKVCTELEDQIKDMEVIIQEFKEREIQWDNIKLTYEQAVNAREHELVTQQVQAARSETEGQVKQQIESVRALHRADLEKLHHNLREERAQVCKLSHKLEESEQKEKSALQLFESQMKEMEKSNQEKMTLKEELTQALSENCSLRKENLKLRKHLDEAMDKFEMIIGEKVSLENFTEALQALHFLDKYKFESTIGQQMKLIDYLQELHLEHSGKKKKSKFFGSKSGSKEALNKQASLPLSDLQTTQSLLQDQVDQLRQENAQQANEILKLKQRGQVEANVEVRLTRSALNALTNPGATHSAEVAGRNSSTSLASASSSSSRSSPHHTPRSQRGYLFDGTRQADHIPQRMHHNIPHRFATGLNTRAAKCGLCLGTVHFVRQASKCQECGMVVHPKCSSSVPSTCGLPTEYVRHFELMMRQIYRDETGRETDIDRSAVKMEGWLKVPRVGKSGWENRYCILEGTWLSLYLDEQDSNPVDSFDLNPIDADVSVHCAVTSAELSNTASTDLHYVLRLDQDPLTTCWPGRYLYLMTTNFQEKQRWVASLEAIVKSAQCKSDLYRNRSQTLIVMSLKEEERREFNCTLVISAQLVLVGTDDGLYAFNPQALTSKRKHMTQLTGFGSVHQMALAKGVDLILLLTGPERRLVMLENKLVKCRMSQTLGGETTPFSFKTVEGLQCCTIFDVALWNNASYLCVGTPSKLYLMKYNPSLAMYCVRKEFPSSEPCSCVCLADNYAIVGTERFYKINIEHPSLLDFVDRQDNSLAFAAYGAANHNSFPLSVVRVSPESLPLEFLLCFHEFGVFVDHRGQRSRATDIKWSGLPLAFAYVEPFLYVTYTNTIQATVVPTDKSQAKGRQTVIDVQSPRYLGPAPGAGCVYISSTTTNITEIICLRGQEDLTADSDKENCLMASSEKQVHFVSPRKPQRFQQLAKEGSLSSLTSNSSSSTFASVESGV
ncbi:citron rho-interacting kinase-like isoform X2 [Physella acuta]|uniref:citron rho-interacting kinase-like isoform X2 n=1 Tax=Physella acuta TaxID=109671 RepID=UPI0027DCF76F|nr:citron rho-interacting kinase-like isoform X2 [Physella acuta]